jgi:hypothetical protein
MTCEVGGMTLLDYFAEDNIAEGDTLFFNYTVESSMQVVIFGIHVRICNISICALL